MIHRFQNVVHFFAGILLDSYRSRFKNISRLIMSEFIPFHMVGMEGEVNHQLMVDASFDLILLF